MSNTIEILKNRRSVRKYKPDMVSKRLIAKITEAGLYAPSGMNRQPCIILAVTDKAVRDRLSQMNASVMGSNSDPFYGAPVVLVVLADRRSPTYLYDGSLVMGNLMNAAYAEGLGSCWIHRAKQVFDSEEGKAILKSAGIEGDYEGIGNCIIGYADEAPSDKPRKSDSVYYL